MVVVLGRSKINCLILPRALDVLAEHWRDFLEMEQTDAMINRMISYMIDIGNELF